MHIDDALFNFEIEARETLAMKRDGQYIIEPGSEPHFALMRLMGTGLMVPPYIETPNREAYRAWIKDVAVANDIVEPVDDFHIAVPKVPYVEGAYPEPARRDMRSGLFTPWPGNPYVVDYARDWTVMTFDQALRHLAKERLTINRHHTSLDSPTRALEWMKKHHPDWYADVKDAA